VCAATDPKPPAKSASKIEAAIAIRRSHFPAMSLVRVSIIVEPSA
jgi:hypothetical protein